MSLLRNLTCLLLAMNIAHAAGERLYFGTYTGKSGSKGIYTAVLDSASGGLSDFRLAGEAASPSYLALSPDGRTLFACEEAANGQVAAFRVEKNASLTRLGEQATRGRGTCHVSVDAAGRHVLAANYGGGSIAVLPVAADGSLEPASDTRAFTGSGPDPKRQDKPYAHSVFTSRDDRFVYACDLGTDEIRIFKYEAGTLTDLPAAKVPPGSGPRMLAFSEDQRHVWVVNEMGLSVTTFARDSETGALTAQQTLPVLPDGAPVENCKSAALRLHPNGQWLYASTRGTDTLTAFSVGEDSQLAVLQNIAPGVKTPRDFAIDPSGRWLVVAGQDDNQLRVLAVDPATGRLAPTGHGLQVPNCVNVLFAPERKTL